MMKAERTTSEELQTVNSQMLARRTVLQNLLMGTAAGSLLDLLRIPAMAAPAPKFRNKSLILLWQDGGPSHFETFDPKPNAPREFRGELGAISTALPGVQFCEILPRLSQLANRFSVIRSIHQPSSGHVEGTHNFITGHEGSPVVNGKSPFPDVASIIHRVQSLDPPAGALDIGESTDPRLAAGMLNRSGVPGKQGPAQGELPCYIGIGGQYSIGLHRGGPAYLGPAAGAFEVAGDPSLPDFRVQNLRRSATRQQFNERLLILRQLNQLGRRGANRQKISRTAGLDLDLSGQMSAIDRFQQQAFELLSGSGHASRAFDLTREDRKTRERYGLHTAGQQALMARRLVEAGARVTAIRFSPDGRGDGDRSGIGWDDHAVHGNIFQIMRRRGPQFDQAVSALIEDLEERGLHEQVMVVLAGEFGRTPRIHQHKGCPGREHWGPAGNVLIYGGGLQMGQVIGATNEKGERPVERPLKPQDVLATIYYFLGINPDQTLVNEVGRPIPILPTGKPIRELIG